MRNYPFIARAFLGAAALSTLVAACEEVDPPKKMPVTTTQAPSKPGAARGGAQARGRRSKVDGAEDRSQD